MARILVVSLVYPPDVVSTASLLGDIACGLSNAGHELTVVTTIPHSNPPEDVERNPAFRASLLKPLRESREGAIRVIRVYMPRKGRRVWSRLFDYSWFQFWVTAVGLLKSGPVDVVLITSPPITLGIAGVLLARLRRAAFVYDLRELWPDAPVQLGLIRNPLLIRLAYAIERFVYQRADAISLIARTFAQRLKDSGAVESKLYFTPNFVDVERFKPGQKTNALSLEWGVAESFVVLYAGNIGLTQGIDILVDVGRAFQGHGEIQILIVGDGAARMRLQKTLMDSGLTNVRWLPYQPAERVEDLYAAADVCVVLLRAGFAHSTIPSKLYTAMSAGRAIVLAAEAASEAAQLLHEAQAGLCVAPDSAAELTAAIRELRANGELRGRLGANGRKWVVEHYSRERVLATYDRMIREISSPKPGQNWKKS